MASSRTFVDPVGASRREHLLSVLARVPDPRDPRGVRHSVSALLAVAVAAVLAGARSFTAIGEWVGDAGAETLAGLGLSARAEESTIRRLFARLDANALDRALGAFLFTRTGEVGRRRVIAIDGKTVRGARPRGRSRTGAQPVAPHLVAALDHAAGAVLGQLAVTEKSNEIPCVRTLLACFDLHGAVVTWTPCTPRARLRPRSPATAATTS